MSCDVNENSLKRPIDPYRLLQYSDIRFVVNGEPFDEEVINRPSYDLIKAITDKYYDKRQLGSPYGSSYIGLETDIADVHNVQQFVDFVTDNMVTKSRKIKVGAGLSGGGDLSGDILIETTDTLLVTDVDQTVEGTKIFKNPPIILGDVVDKSDAVNLGYVMEEIDKIAEESIPFTRRIIAGEGVIGGGQLGEDVEVRIDSEWLVNLIRDSYEFELSSLVSSYVNSAISDVIEGRPDNNVTITKFPDINVTNTESPNNQEDEG